MHQTDVVQPLDGRNFPKNVCGVHFWCMTYGTMVECVWFNGNGVMM